MVIIILFISTCITNKQTTPLLIGLDVAQLVFTVDTGSFFHHSVSLLQASMLTEPGGPFIDVSKLNLSKYAQKPALAKVLRRCTNTNSILEESQF